jgi:peptide-methionine (S)-S-oxide reductase
VETATLSGGCFWCTEAIFKKLKGVARVIPGYTGGETQNPTYWDVASKSTGHAEAIQLQFDPKVISFKQILDVFWALHDPTTLNQQGADVGPEYRSAIFYQDNTQKKTAEESKNEAQKRFKDPIVTEITQASKFYPAEEEHRDFYEKNKSPIYCRLVIDPKIQKLYKEFKDQVKDSPTKS